MNLDVKYILLHLLALVLILPACNQDFDINIPEPDDKIVIDGWIEMRQHAKVLLTANSPYFTVIDSASLRDLVLTRAKVSLSDGYQSENLILRKDTNYFPPYYYEGNIILGTPGKTYTLLAEYGGKSAWAETTIPEAVPLDTTYFRLAEGEDSLGIIYLEFTDPLEIKNYYRIFTKRIGVDNKFIPSVVMALDDKYFTGKRAEFSLYRQSENALAGSRDNYFRLEDTVVIKLSTIDKAHFDFWSSLQNEVTNANNPFASSLIEVRSNVEGDGLGIWGGYGSSYDTIYPVSQKSR